MLRLPQPSRGVKVGEGDWLLAEATSLGIGLHLKPTFSAPPLCFACGFLGRSLISKDGNSYVLGEMGDSVGCVQLPLLVVSGSKDLFFRLQKWGPV